MLKKIILLSITASISHGAHAGLFDSNDFNAEEQTLLQHFLIILRMMHQVYYRATL